MDLFKILDAKPETVLDSSQFNITPEYQNSNDYKLMTPLADFQKELIDQVVSLHYSDILKFFERVQDDDVGKKSIFYHDQREGSQDAAEKNEKEEEEEEEEAAAATAAVAKSTTTKEQVTIDSLDTLLMNSQLVCTHPYLLIDHYFPKSLVTKQIPERLAETSGKFQVFAKLLQLLDSIYNLPERKSNSDSSNSGHHHNNSDKKYEPRQLDLVVVARPGRTIDLIDAICLGHKVNLKRYVGMKVKEASGGNNKSAKSNKTYNVNIHLFPSDFKNLNENMELPSKDLVKFLISFDISCDVENPIIQNSLKNQNTKIIRLVPINTIEHIVLYYRNLVSSRNYSDYLKPVTSALVVLRDRVGQIPSELRPLYEEDNNNLNQYLSNWFDDPISNKWPLPDLSNIPNFTSKDVEKSLLTEVKFNFESDNNNFNGNYNGNYDENMNGGGNNGNNEINFNSNGKTKMIGHILQPFFNSTSGNLNTKKQDYYSYKRLERRYLNNPINSNDFELITGINSTENDNANTESLSESSHDHKEKVMTHKFMYEYSKEFSKLIRLNGELQSFDKFSSSRFENIKMIETDSDTIAQQLSAQQDKIGKFEIKVVNQRSEITELNQIKTKLENDIDQINNDENNDEWVANQVKILGLKEKIAKLKAKKESLENETNYMTTEIERASRSTAESTKDIENITKELNELKVKKAENNKLIIGNDYKASDLKIKKELLARITAKNNELKEQLKLTNKKLQESNMNFSNSGNSGRARYVNYSRNGLNTKIK